MNDAPVRDADYLSNFNDDFPEKVEARYFWYVGRSIIIQKCLALAKKSLPPVTRVIEIGCGTGKMLQTLQKLFTKAIGYDRYEPAIATCKKNGLTAAYLKEDTSLPEASVSVDLICGFDVFEHIEDDQAMFKECSRVLKTGAFLLLTVPAKMKLWSPVDTYDRHFRRYEKDELIQKVRQAGFEPVLVSYFIFLLYPLFRINRLYLKWRGRPPENIFSINPVLNGFLTIIIRIEAFLFGKIPFPTGSSLICLAQKAAG